MKSCCHRSSRQWTDLLPITHCLSIVLELSYGLLTFHYHCVVRKMSQIHHDIWAEVVIAPSRWSSGIFLPEQSCYGHDNLIVTFSTLVMDRPIRYRVRLCSAHPCPRHDYLIRVKTTSVPIIVVSIDNNLIAIAAVTVRPFPLRSFHPILVPSPAHNCHTRASLRLRPCSPIRPLVFTILHMYTPTFLKPCPRY